MALYLLYAGNMKVLSLYSGAGGIDEGLKQIGINTTLAIDNEKDCIQTMKLNHGCETLCANVEDVESTLDCFDIIVGGPPCPEFSRAKVDRTLNPIEVNRFWSIVDKIKPKYFLMENVQDVIKVCNRKNYLINCANYGVPQTRVRRIFTNLPLPRETHAKTACYTLAGDVVRKWVSVKDALGLDGIIQDRKTTFGEGGYREYDADKPSNTIVSDARQWYISCYGHTKQNRDNITRSINEPSDTIVCANDMRLTDYEIKSQKKLKYRIKRDGFERKLSNNELLILQGFPKNYRFFGSKSSIRKQIGNAFPPPCTKAFFGTTIDLPNNVDQP